MTETGESVEEIWPTRFRAAAVQRPRSATHGVVVLCGMVTMMVALVLIRTYHYGTDVQQILFICGTPGLVMLAVGWFLDPPPVPMATQGPFFSVKRLARSLVKLLGFCATLATIALFYWFFPEYHGSFYDRAWDVLHIVAVPVMVLALPYIYVTDARLSHPDDGYWHMGMAALCQFREVDLSVLGQHFLGWTVKAYFLPLMFLFSCDNVKSFLAVDFSSMHGFDGHYEWLYNFLFFLDVLVATIGYTLSLKLFGTQIRSTEPTVLGWGSAVICYPPFWSWIGPQYFNYDSGVMWGQFVTHNSVLFFLWGVAILFLVFIYVWATFAFGCRFSNLTHRGIITNGPYRWTKHPAYVSKNISWWLVSVPFLAIDPLHALRACSCLAGVNFIYFVRARTEERHLSLDPVYRDYAAWIDAHGALRWLPRFWPALVRPLYVADVTAATPVSRAPVLE